MNDNKKLKAFPIAVSKFAATFRGTDDEVWMGIIKRKCWDRKYTMEEWKKLLSDLKSGKSL